MNDSSAPVLVRRPGSHPLPRLTDLGFEQYPTGRLRRSYLIGRPFVFLALYWAMASLGWWVPALVCVFGLFVTGVAVLNDLIHRTIGASPRTAKVSISLISALMLENGAAVRETHLQHHFGAPNEWDPEAYIDSMSWPRLLLECPRYRYRLWGWALRERPAARTAVLAHAVAHIAVIAAAVAVPSQPLRLLVGSVLLAGLVFPLVSAKGPQNGWGKSDPNLTIVRGRYVPRLLLGMVYHLEHHLYPQVPTYRLSELAERLSPWLVSHGVTTVKVW